MVCSCAEIITEIGNVEVVRGIEEACVAVPKRFLIGFTEYRRRVLCLARSPTEGRSAAGAAAAWGSRTDVSYLNIVLLSVTSARKSSAGSGLPELLGFFFFDLMLEQDSK